MAVGNSSYQERGREITKAYLDEAPCLGLVWPALEWVRLAQRERRERGEGGERRR